MKMRSKKTGLPPGSLVHIGEKKTAAPRISVLDYDDQTVTEREVALADECIMFRDRPTVTWINVEGLHEINVLQRLGDCYGFHPLVLEDIANTDQRAKIEDYGDYLYVVLRMLSYRRKEQDVMSEQISLIVGKNYVISFQEGAEGDVFGPVRDRIRHNRGRIRREGADHLAYSLVDAVVDNYFSILEGLGEEIEEVEDRLLHSPAAETLRHIHRIKRELIFLRKAVWPLREVISGLQRTESPIVRPSTKIYLRDVYDHTIQVMDTIETFRDMAAGMIDIYLSSASNRMNEIMKVLTIIATIFMPLTFLAGIYGMNFRHMPELDWPFGYPLVWAASLLIGVSMLYYFRKKKWL